MIIGSIANCKRLFWITSLWRICSCAVLVSLVILVIWGCGDDFDSGVPVRTVKGSATSVSFEGGRDWPQWRGLNRDGISPERGIVRKWSLQGPKEIWRKPIGIGYSSIVVSRGKAFTLAQDETEHLIAVSAESGEELWRFSIGPPFSDGQGDGPRGTPSVAEGLVFAVGAHGTLVAVDEETGTLVWKQDFASSFGGRRPTWGYATSPLVEGDFVLVEPGGAGEKSVAAFNRADGRLVWSAYGDPPGYSSPVVVDFEGQRQAVFFVAKHLIGVKFETGQLLWEVPWTTSYDVNAVTPIWIAPDRLFVSSDYDVGGAILELKSSGPPRQVWKNGEMRNHFNSSLYLDGALYGFDNATLKCLNASDGSVNWAHRGLGRGSLIAADGLLIVLGERGELSLLEATPKAYNELATAQVLTGKCWTSPTLSHGKLYLRNQKEIVCLDLSE